MSDFHDNIAMILERMLDGDEPEKYVHQFATEIAALSPIGANPASLPTRTPEELESLLSLAMGALEPFGKAASIERKYAPSITAKQIAKMESDGALYAGLFTNAEVRQASQVIAQIKGGQE